MFLISTQDMTIQNSVETAYCEINFHFWSKIVHDLHPYKVFQKYLCQLHVFNRFSLLFHEQWRQQGQNLFYYFPCKIGNLQMCYVTHIIGSWQTASPPPQIASLQSKTYIVCNSQLATYYPTIPIINSNCREHNII